MISEGMPYGIIDPDYARVFTMSRCLAWSEGYALLFHGSFTRDLDLVAVPWTKAACEPAHLLKRFKSAEKIGDCELAENSKIEWCDHTFNGWVGCQKVSAGCDNCYAEAMMDKRYHKVEWGPHGERKRTSEANWKLPLRWAKAARVTGERPKVFCSSLADVFDNKAPPGARPDLFRLVEATPELDWLLLTKRPENISDMIDDCGWFRGFPRNVWLGTTCEDQAAYDRRWPILANFNVRVRFISYEPAIGPLTILNHKEKPDWIICGGESGKSYRLMAESWARCAMEECADYFVPFFMKQMAGKKQIPDDLLIRQFPRALAVTPAHGGKP